MDPQNPANIGHFEYGNHWFAVPAISQAFFFWGLEAKEPRELEPPEPGCRGFHQFLMGTNIANWKTTSC